MTKLYTCDEVAARYGVEKATVWKWIRCKKLAAFKVGKCYKVSEEHIKDFETSQLTIV
ncbi:helix-turn-helix domain-containing protein [Anaerosporobacter sp.]